MKKFLALVLISISFSFTNAQNVKERTYLLPTNASLLSAQWTEDFDAAIELALKQKKLLFISATQNPDKIALSKENENWKNSEFKKYLDDNFICVLIPLKSTSEFVSSAEYKVYSINEKFSQRHNELIADLSKKYLLDANIVFDPQSDKSVRVKNKQKTALGWMDDLEEAKSKILENYKRKNILANPNETLPNYQIEALKRKRIDLEKQGGLLYTPIKTWHDDFKKAEALSLENKKPIFIWLSNQQIKRVLQIDAFSSPEFLNFAKENLILARAQIVFEEIGKYKYIYKIYPQESPYQNYQEEVLNNFGELRFPGYIIYLPQTKKFVSRYLPHEDAKEMLLDIQMDLLKLRKEN